MKQFKQLILTITLVLVATFTFSQTNKKHETITIQSSIQCGSCVNRLNSMFSEFNAVKGVEYDTEEHTISVTYNKKKTTPDEIRDKITAVGYDADEKQAKIEPYLELPPCCQKGGHAIEPER